MSYHRPSRPRYIPLEPSPHDYHRFPFNRELRTLSDFESDNRLQITHRFVWLWAHSRLPEAVGAAVVKSGLSYYGLRPAIIPAVSGDITIIVSKGWAEKEIDGLEWEVEEVLEGFGVFERVVKVVEF